LAVTLLARFVLKEKVSAIGWLFIAGSMTGAELGLLAFVAVAGSYGQFFMVLAFAKAPASVLSPYLYSAIGFSALGGWLMFNHLPDLWALIGMLMIAGFGLASVGFNRR
jgi:drug/metabolite transporter (DMT)-like permease